MASLLTRVVTMVAAVVTLPAASAFAAAADTTARTAGANARAAAGESTPIDLSGAAGDQGAQIGGGGSIVRTIVGLAIVIGVIYGVAWVLRQVKASREPRATGAGLATLASVPLGSGRSVHLVSAGKELVLLGVAEQGVVPIRTYSEDEALAAGLIDEDGLLILPAEERAAADRPARRFTLPQGQRLALPAPKAAVETLRSWTVRR